MFNIAMDLGLNNIKQKLNPDPGLATPENCDDCFSQFLLLKKRKWVKYMRRADE